MYRLKFYVSDSSLIVKPDLDFNFSKGKNLKKSRLNLSLSEHASTMPRVLAIAMKSCGLRQLVETRIADEALEQKSRIWIFRG